MPFAQMDGRRLYYEVHGAGPPVVFLHHGFASSRMWEKVYPAFLDRGYKVVLHDRRGFGQSEPGANFDEFFVSDSFREETRDDLARLVEALELDSVFMVGQCEGGVMGVDYASVSPDRVRALVVSSTLYRSTTTMTEFNESHFPKAFPELDDSIRENLIKWHGHDRAEYVYELARTRGGAYGSEVFDLGPQLGEVACPTLALYPDRSALFEVEQAVGMYRRLPKGELGVIPRCGHNTYDRRRDDFVKLVLDFFDRVVAEPKVSVDDYSMTCLAPMPPGMGSIESSS